jgi:hypothetical protein
MKSFATALVASAASSLVTFAGLQLGGTSVLRVERIELAQAGKEPAMVLEANYDGATIRMRAASSDPAERPWSVILNAGLISRPSLSFFDPVWGGAELIQVGLDGEPGSPYLRVGHAKDPQFVIGPRPDERPEAGLSRGVTSFGGNAGGALLRVTRPLAGIGGQPVSSGGSLRRAAGSLSDGRGCALRSA